jgi:adenylate cyclase
VGVDERLLVDAGLYDPDDPGADERRRLLGYLGSLGATIEQMEAANRSGRLAALAGELVTRPDHERLSLDDAAARLGTDAARIQRVLLAAGLSVDAADPLPLTATDLDAVRAFEAGVALVGEEGAFAFTRLLGNAAARVAEASVDLFVRQVADDLVAEGTDEEAYARASAAAMHTAGHVPEAFGHLLHQHLHRAVRRSLLERVDAEPDCVHTTIGFVDLVGSTAWTRGRTLVELSRALVQFEAAAFEIAARHDGWVVKLIGDAAMFEASDPVAACRIGLDLCDAVDACADLPGARGGLASGEVQARDGDYFGTVVNLAARAAGIALPGTLSVNDLLAAHLLDGGVPEGWLVEQLPPQDLRGFDEPPPLHLLSREA